MSTAKHYTFDLQFGAEGRSALNAAQTRRLAYLLSGIDHDGPSDKDVFADGVHGFHWRKPPSERVIVETVSSLRLDFRYRFVPAGRDHKVKDCTRCDEEGPYQYGGICPPVLVESDWKIVRVGVGGDAR